MTRITTLFLVVASFLCAQDATFPLEDILISGSHVAKATVIQIAGLKPGQPINKAGIEDACQKLGQSGIFETVSYRYAPGPKRGYIVTLELADPQKFAPAAFDIPNLDETQLWTWIAAQFPAFNRRVPQAEEAQHYVAQMVEQKWASALHGEHLVVRMEQDFKTGRRLLSFQPEHLPQIAQMNFTGQTRLQADELRTALQKVVANEGYTDRRFRMLAEENLRLVYAQHGMLKAEFPTIQAQPAGPNSVNVTTTIVEGPQYKLADVQFIGDGLPTAQLLKAGNFKKGEIANWSEIQQAVWRTETPVKRTGYPEAASQAERLLNDADQTLTVRVSYRKGPIYHFGSVTFVGLSPDLEEKARKLWAMEPGAPYDFMYAADFVREFGKAVNLHGFKDVKPKSEIAPGDHVRNDSITFLTK